LILVLLGTNPYSFRRLAEAVDAYAGQTGEEVFLQLGHTNYLATNAKYEKFLERTALLAKIEAAELVITQGGCGSIADCLRAGKKVVAVPRLPELHESPDRQEELVRELERLGRLVGVYEIEDLPGAIRRAREIEFIPGNSHIIPKVIMEFIKSK
jgi:UDP-N-acetylglucosamine transferase subunit ALG13